MLAEALVATYFSMTSWVTSACPTILHIQLAFQWSFRLKPSPQTTFPVSVPQQDEVSYARRFKKYVLGWVKLWASTRRAPRRAQAEAGKGLGKLKVSFGRRANVDLLSASSISLCLCLSLSLSLSLPLSLSPSELEAGRPRTCSRGKQQQTAASVGQPAKQGML